MRVRSIDGHGRSPIGDEEIAVAAAWLAGQVIEADGIPAGDADFFARRFRRQLLRHRLHAGPNAYLGLSFPSRSVGHIGVRVAPGGVLGYRDHGLEPCWWWPEVPVPADSIA